ncbi:MAG: F0F1 ATP synthase subunit A, partial [Planctomycetaceae bacterium]|nr:F0F1 ATP synthase subunit A [Planctomycetaceae bacterium]
MNISPDEPLWQWEFLILNRTILFTWLVMGLLTCGSWLITRKLSSSARLSRGQNLLEVLVSGLRSQIQDVSQQDPGPFLPFVGTLFLFIALSNILSIVPGYVA